MEPVWKIRTYTYRCSIDSSIVYVEPYTRDKYDLLVSLDGNRVVTELVDIGKVKSHNQGFLLWEINRVEDRPGEIILYCNDVKIGNDKENRSIMYRLAKRENIYDQIVNVYVLDHHNVPLEYPNWIKPVKVTDKEAIMVLHDRKNDIGVLARVDLDTCEIIDDLIYEFKSERYRAAAGFTPRAAVGQTIVGDTCLLSVVDIERWKQWIINLDMIGLLYDVELADCELTEICDIADNEILILMKDSLTDRKRNEVYLLWVRLGEWIRMKELKKGRFDFTDLFNDGYLLLCHGTSYYDEGLIHISRKEVYPVLDIVYLRGIIESDELIGFVGERDVDDTYLTVYRKEDLVPSAELTKALLSLNLDEWIEVDPSVMHEIHIGYILNNADMVVDVEI